MIMERAVDTLKVVFLDIDGVLNSRQYDLSRGDNEGNIDISRLSLIKQLVSCTGAQIVLTSTWRIHWDPNVEKTDSIGEEMEEIFLRNGISLYDKTPEINDDRAKEIKSWLEIHPDVVNFVIIDDMKFGWGEFEANVVKTDYRIGRGLEMQHVKTAIKLLSGM